MRLQSLLVGFFPLSDSFQNKPSLGPLHSHFLRPLWAFPRLAFPAGFVGFLQGGVPTRIYPYPKKRETRSFGFISFYPHPIPIHEPSEQQSLWLNDLREIMSLNFSCESSPFAFSFKISLGHLPTPLWLHPPTQELQRGCGAVATHQGTRPRPYLFGRGQLLASVSFSLVVELDSHEIIHKWCFRHAA